jgi:hypothetical protein
VAGRQRPQALAASEIGGQYRIDPPLRDLYPNVAHWLAGLFENKPLYRFARIEIQA